MVVMFGGRVMDVREEQSLNALTLIVVTDSGIDTDVSFVHSLNASSLMVVMFGGRVMDVREEQRENAYLLMVVMFGGRVTVWSFVHPRNAHIPMVEMLVAIVTTST